MGVGEKEPIKKMILNMYIAPGQKSDSSQGTKF